MAISPIMLARLIDNVRQNFQTAINIDIEIAEGAKYGDGEKEIVAASINAINKGLVDLINVLVEIPPKAPEAPAEPVADAPAEPAAEPSAESVPEAPAEPAAEPTAE